ncbi:Transcription factor [Dispira parvispora]|uniref:Transcription factor n=1 Tax=Dispira parvispora TaxID=1520584 RepID=A0A9W8AUL4_9FUNG|nr:Transcription factor [Dispira parvispora]
MTCDEGRPCRRCIKRNIGDKCHDEPPKSHHARTHHPKTTTASGSTASVPPHKPKPINAPNNLTVPNYLQLLMANPLGGFGFGSPQFGDEFSMFNHILKNLDPQSLHVTDGDSHGPTASGQDASTAPSIPSRRISTGALGHAPATALLSPSQNANQPSGQISSNGDRLESSMATQAPRRASAHHHSFAESWSSPHTPTNTADRFFQTAADPSDGTSEGRLRQVISAKYEAGMLKPYNYVNGYARLQAYMEKSMSASGQARILSVLSTFRPAFRSVAQTLTDFDLLVVEEMFERMLLDYDRAFSSMGIPACLWRRTGEIYKANKEFASLIKVPLENLREGKLSIYELMMEESAVNYWEKYGNIAFNASQKAVLTSCILRYPSGKISSSTSSNRECYTNSVGHSHNGRNTGNAAANPSPFSTTVANPHQGYFCAGNQTTPSGHYPSSAADNTSLQSTSSSATTSPSLPYGGGSVGGDFQSHHHPSTPANVTQLPHILDNNSRLAANVTTSSASIAIPQSPPPNHPPPPPPPSSRRTTNNHPPIPCCFSFTIRRDQYNIPLVIVGNFIPVRPK